MKAPVNFSDKVAYKITMFLRWLADTFFKKQIISFEEKNTTFRAKKRYFELFPIRGLRNLLPKEIFIMNKNLDAVSALIILEDLYNEKFTLSEDIEIKTWLK